ncbi:MAG: TonB-dependent receptor [Halobacteriales archaeon]|nr:TonB-dependent receptor [Halobacteriales archaeon]
MSIRLRVAAALALALLPVASPLYGQATTDVVGVVTSDAVPVQDASVGLVGNPFRALTGPDGRFTLRGIEPGSYVLVVERIGFGTVQRDITVPLDTELGIELSTEAVPLAGINVTGQRLPVVSATRTQTPLIEIPQNIQVVGREVFSAQAVTELSDAMRNISNVTHTGTYNGGYENFSSRGFWMSTIANYRRNGLMLPNFGRLYSENIERIEVLKGPGGILYGDVTPGGVINLVTEKPLGFTRRQASITVDEFGLVRPSLDLTGPLTNDRRVRYRLNASAERGQSFRDQVENDAFMVAPSIAWEPNSETSLLVEASWKTDDRVGDPGLVSPDGSVDALSQVPIDRFLGEPSATYGYEDRDVTATLERWVADRWRLRLTGGYNHSDRMPLNIYADGVENGDDVVRRQYYFQQFRRTATGSVELVGEFLTGGVTHELLVGADWQRHSSRGGDFQEGGIDEEFDLFDPTYGVAELRPFDEDFRADNFLLTRRAGVYVQDQIGLMDDRLQVLAGLRWNDYVQGQRYDEGADLPDEPGSDVEDRIVSPRLGVVWKIRPWLSTYGSYSEAYEINGFDWQDPTVPVPPTYATQYEFGVKGDLLGERLGFTLAAFNLEKDDVYGWAYENPSDPAAADWAWYTYSGAVHRSRGIELDANGRLTDRISLVASLAFTEAEIVEDPAFETGNALANTPGETFSLWTNWEPAGSFEAFEFGGGVFYKSAFYGTMDNSEGGLVPANHTIDLSAAWQRGPMTMRLVVRNVTDRVSYLGGFGNWEPQAPRRLMLTVGTTF